MEAPCGLQVVGAAGMVLAEHVTPAGGKDP